MSEVVNIVVALAVIVFVFRWATSSKETPSERDARMALGFRPKKVTPEMVETVSNMFPDMPKDNIRYDLLRTGSVEVTTNKLIERGLLDPPPAGYFRLYPRTAGASPYNANSTSITRASGSGTSSAVAGSLKQPNLISRYRLETRLSDDSTVGDKPEEAGGKAAWEATAEKREASLQERKAKMILAARKRLLEQQRKESEASS